MQSILVCEREEQLIREYRSKTDSQERCEVIRDYARLMHISQGCAEDELDTWVHLLATAGQHRKAGLLAAMLMLGAAAFGQTSRGTVTGTVQDPTGAAIVAAEVKLTGVDTGVRLATVSNDTGVYRFDAVDLGVYELKVMHPGFQGMSRAELAWRPTVSPRSTRAWQWAPRNPESRSAPGRASS
jgi:hypothetical protein